MREVPLQTLRDIATGRRALVFLVVTGGALAATGVASAATVTVPTVDPSSYGQTLLDNIGNQLKAVLPYAAAFTAFAIGVAFIKGWIGRKKATQVAH